MIEQKQLFYHRPSQGEIGDCFRTCVACVLNEFVEAVPHFIGLHYVNEQTNVMDEARDNLNQWLSEHPKYSHLKFVEYPLDCDLDHFKVYLEYYYKDIYVIVGCNSSNGGHSVVMKNKDYMWDPAKDNSGCVGPMEDGYFWLGLFVRTGE